MRRHTLLCALPLSLAGVSSADGQDSVVTLRPQPKLRGASRRELLFGGTAGGSVVAFDAMTASAVYWTVCGIRHRGDPPRRRPEDPFDLAPQDVGTCAPPSGESVAIGWLGGALAGSAGAAATVAIWRGCPKRSDVLRSIAGAAVGSLPGLVAYSNSRRADRYPSKHTCQIGMTPLIAGVGSALAVVNCHSR